MFPARTLTHKTCYTATSITVLKNKGGFVISLLNSLRDLFCWEGRRRLRKMVWEGLSPPHVSRHPLAPAQPTLGLLGAPDLMRLCVTRTIAHSTLSLWNAHSRSLGNPHYPLRWVLGRKPPPPRSPSRQGCAPLLPDHRSSGPRLGRTCFQLWSGESPCSRTSSR